ncbi:MAG: HDIG domain-containing protein [Flavobacteriales bacterium]|nr:HDIG domain-containing protein [Flavobacteriales bacterium]
MKYSWKDRIRNYALVQRSLAYLLTLFVVFLFFPKEDLFKFEYQLNRPWKHEKLIAPFDLGIRKTDEQITEEQADLAKAQPPVFSISLTSEQSILTHMDDAWEVSTDSALTCDSLRAGSMQFVADVLKRGVIQQGPTTKDLTPHDAIMIDRGGTVQQMDYGDAFLLSEVMDSMQVLIDSLSEGPCKTAFANIIRSNIASNAIYNDSLTQKLIKGSYEGILTIEGKINRGQEIIDRGEIINDQRYKALESLKKEYAERTISKTGFRWSLVGEMAIVALLLGLLVLFIYLNQEKLFNDPRPITLALSLVAIAFAVTSLAQTSNAASVYIIPIGIAPLLLRMFFDFRVSLFSFIILVLMVALFASNPLEFILVQLSAISFATLYQSSSTKRSRMLGTAALVFMGYSVIYMAISLAQNGSLSGIQTENFGWFAINGLLCTMVFPLIYVVEKVFGFISETTLLELSDSNQPLLKELAVKAPGTFQHSMQVANLAEKVASKIGGNAVLLRTAAMYHDIGKMNEPQFFIENQLPDNNPHDDLEPEESASIIIGHVTLGIEKAREHDLPIDVIQFIRTHHGTSTVRFFLKKALDKDPEIDPLRFTYPGPRPNTKEQAILMMADSVEAASRSLKQYDRETLDGLVDRIVDYQRSEGQFEEAPITFRDITEAKAVLKAALKGIFHQRISYD